MTNYSSKILGNSTSALAAQQALIANISNNIANVNTKGFVRREVNLLSRSDAGSSAGGLQIGSGVEVGEVRRLANTYLDDAQRAATSEKGANDLRNEYLSRVEQLFGLKEGDVTIGSALNDFFSAINQLTGSPANMDLRLNVLQRGEDLVTTIKGAYTTVAKTQTELDKRLYTEVNSINEFTDQIAKINLVIASQEVGGGVAAPERDQRDVILQQLAEKISYTLREQPNGSVDIMLEDGFPLVLGTTSRALKVSSNPSFVVTGTPSLEGGALSYVTYDYGTSSAPLDQELTYLLARGSGSVGGLLGLRGLTNALQTSAFQADGDLVDVASRIEALTRTLLTTVNQTYRGPDEDSSTANLQPSSGDLNGNSPGVFGLFDFTFTGTKDVNGNGVADLSDLTDPSIGIDSFSRMLVFGVSQPANFAAARDANAAAGATSFPTGDSSNAQALVALRTTNLSFSAGSFTYTGTFEGLYTSTLAFVGNAAATAQSEAKVAAANYDAAANRRDSFSAVNLDEEFANLIRFQKAFQASARMIRTASELLDAIVSLI
jgi:flagellar hook-associated protein 1 FlgK